MSKTNRPYLLLIIILLLTSLACQLSFNLPFRVVRGSGNVVTEERQVDDFSRIDFSGIGEIEIELGDQSALIIEAEDNLMPLIETEVRGDTLRIGFRDNVTPSPTEPIRYSLTVTSLESIETSGLGNVTAPDLQSGQFNVAMSGAGSIDISSLEANSLDVDMSGLGNLSINGGTVDNLEVSMSGGGDFDAEDMQVTEARVDISGLGSATIRVSDRLDAEISGGGSVRYYGDPTVNEEVSGLGNIERLGD
jgi:hypothetical protein